MMSRTFQKVSMYAPYLDVLRIICSFMVVMVHVSAQEWGNVPVNSIDWQVLNIYDCLVIPSVPLFFMISGALFLNESYELSLKKLYFSKILHLFVVYHAWMLFYNLLPFFHGELAWTYENIKFEIIFDTLEGIGIYHLWFIPELIILYLITPILKEAFRKKETCQYFLCLFLVVGAVLPALLLYDFPYKRFVSSYYSRTSLVMLTGYIGYYVAGHYIHSFVSSELSKKKQRILIGLAVLSYAITIVACSVDALQKNEPSAIMNTPLAAPHFVATVCIFMLVKNACRNLEVKNTSWIRNVAKLSFGIYLIHPLVIDIVAKLGLSTIEPNPIIMVPVFGGIVFGVSAVIVFLLRKVPGVRALVS